MKNINQITSIKTLREIANTYNAQQINQCLKSQISHQTNECAFTGAQTEVVNALARAGVVRQLVDDGASLSEATRELGRRMRNVIELKA